MQEGNILKQTTQIQKYLDISVRFARLMSKSLCTDSTLLPAVNFLALSKIAYIQPANDTVNVI